MLVPVGEQAAVTNAMIVLTPVAAAIWTALKESTDYQFVLERILDEFDVEESVARKDLDEFLAEMKSEGLIVE